NRTYRTPRSAPARISRDETPAGSGDFASHQYVGRGRILYAQLPPPGCLPASESLDVPPRGKSRANPDGDRAVDSRTGAGLMHAAMFEWSNDIERMSEASLLALWWLSSVAIDPT